MGAASQGLGNGLWSLKHGLVHPNTPTTPVCCPPSARDGQLPPTVRPPSSWLQRPHSRPVWHTRTPAPRSGQQGQRHRQPRLRGVCCISQRETLSRRDIWGLSQNGSGGFHSDCPSLRGGRAWGGTLAAQPSCTHKVDQGLGVVSGAIGHPGGNTQNRTLTLGEKHRLSGWVSLISLQREIMKLLGANTGEYCVT